VAPPHVIGLDFGTASARAIVADAARGTIIARATFDYPHGEHGVIASPADALLARHHPADDRAACSFLLAAVTAEAARTIDLADIVAIGVDATASTPMPVDERLRPLALDAAFEDDPDALAWLWKDHTASAEAAEITAALAAASPGHLGRCGQAYSSEWFWSKILRAARTNQRVSDAAAAWVEQSDAIPAFLAGLDDAATMPRNMCAAGHKSLYAADLGGLPPAALLADLHPTLARIAKTFRMPAVTSDTAIGTLAPGLAEACGLAPTVTIAAGIIDAHAGAIGAGIRSGAMVKIMGTSTCDILLAPPSVALDIPGMCGAVLGSVVPGQIGIEAGQSAVGDLFDWFVRVLGGSPSAAEASALHARLTGDAARLRPGESGLLALDWNNGNRCVLVDPNLTGVLIGQSLATTAAEIYRALIEATAFGARTIVDRLAERGADLDTIIACGGIAEKNAVAMQIYADVLGRDLHIAAAADTCALGAAINAAVAGGVHPDLPTAIAAMTRPATRVLRPDPQAAAVYDELFAIYTDLHDAFGTARPDVDVRSAMKALLRLRAQQRSRGASPGH
jgi:L-ribulokinase